MIRGGLDGSTAGAGADCRLRGADSDRSIRRGTRAAFFRDILKAWGGIRAAGVSPVITVGKATWYRKEGRCPLGVRRYFREIGNAIRQHREPLCGEPGT